ncbi:MAG: EAL domain-containing protein [Clostridia bacterium]|nr:EAL domain-containing protein [Clostridia bacterium]
MKDEADPRYYSKNEMNISATGAVSDGASFRAFENETGATPAGLAFFKEAAERADEFTGGGWCVAAVYPERCKLLRELFGWDEVGPVIDGMTEEIKRAARLDGGIGGFIPPDRFFAIIKDDEDRIAALYEKLSSIFSRLGAPESFSVILGVAAIDGSSPDINVYFNRASLVAEEKTEGNLRIRRFDAVAFRRYAEEFRLLSDFRNAIANGEISFCLQPQYNVKSGKIVGAESLARWVRKDGVAVSPAYFVPILEKSNLITKLDAFIWDSVCRWIRDRRRAGRQTAPISVNVSRVDLLSFDVKEHFDGLIGKYGLSRKDVKIEITESACVGDSHAVYEEISRLREEGYSVLMDDFGSGYSSLNMLGRIRVDVIKLDAQFLRIDRREENRGINVLESIFNMTKTLGTPVIAEGVERREQVRFLSGLGCGYMQGYYFSPPMTVAEFEALIDRGDAVDPAGIVFRANEQFRTTEFLSESVYSDAMINNILGPVAFYRRHGEDIDIIRYNEQFFELVGIEPAEMNVRRYGIQKYLVPDDVAKLNALLDYAGEHRAVGAQGTVRAIRPDGTVVSFSLRIYSLGIDDDGERFYCSARDVSELQLLNYDLPGAYFRCTVDAGSPFIYVSENFKEMTGYGEDDLRELFGNKLINMIHPADRAQLEDERSRVAAGELRTVRPYRIKVKDKGYVWVAEQARLTDVFGKTCRQCVLIDVDDVMKIRNQMRLLTKYMTDTILFLRRRDEGLVFETAVHGLGGAFGEDAERFTGSMNGGAFFDRIGFGGSGLSRDERAMRFAESIEGVDRAFTVRLDGGAVVPIIAHSFRVRDERAADERSTAEYIILLHHRDKPVE